MKRYGIKSSSKRQKGGMHYLRLMSRLLMGALFIFSGYVKMVDPFGFSLKMEEIFVSMGMDFMVPASMVFAFLGILAEFVIGFALLLGIQMQLAAWGLMIFMSFFLLLTCWLAYAPDVISLINRLFDQNFQYFVVTDCGCFGDFIKLNNHQTFYKNLIFMAFTVFIFAQRKQYKQQHWYYITQWFPILLVTGFGLFTMFHCLHHEPWHDFRPWKKGEFIAGKTYSQAPEVDFVFQYKHNESGEIREITMDELTAIVDDSLMYEDFEANYVYHNRIEKVIKPGINAALSDFTITDLVQKRDFKNHFITSADYTFIIMMRDVTQITPKKFASTLALIEELKLNDKEFVVITGSLQEESEAFNKENNTDIYFYYSDVTPLKTALRNNLGLILIKEGYVIDKWSYRDIPIFDEITNSIPKYEQKLKKYKIKQPPRLPDGTEIIERAEEVDIEVVE
jgi:uncharacterized membrane protein YphA (DoxX/SURF4 family)